MPTATNDGVSLYYETDGDGEPVAFVSDVGYGAWLWGWQAPALAGPYETIVPNTRGTGASDAPPGPYTVEGLAADLEAVLADAGARNAAIVGAGLGGMVALAHARRYSRARRLVLIGTAASGDAVDPDGLASLYAPRDDEAALRASLDPLLTGAFREARPDVVERIVAWRREGDADRAAWEAHAAATREFEAGPVYEVSVPALVLHGIEDPVVPVGAGRELAADLPRGTFEAVEGRHGCFVEHSVAVTDAIVGFLDETGE